MYERVTPEVARQIILDNYMAESGSFLYDLTVRQSFDEAHFYELCGAINALVGSYVASLEERQLLMEINEIAYQVLVVMLYHYNPKEPFVLADVPDTVSEYFHDLHHSLRSFNKGETSALT